MAASDLKKFALTCALPDKRYSSFIKLLLVVVKLYGVNISTGWLQQGFVKTGPRIIDIVF